MLKAIAIAGALLAASQAAEALFVGGVSRANHVSPTFHAVHVGRFLAERYCVECHTTKETGVIGSFPPAPPFASVVAETYDRQSLTVVLVTRGHPDSLRAVLAPDRIDDLLAYLHSLSNGAPGEG